MGCRPGGNRFVALIHHRLCRSATRARGAKSCGRLARYRHLRSSCRLRFGTTNFRRRTLQCLRAILQILCGLAQTACAAASDTLRLINRIVAPHRPKYAGQAPRQGDHGDSLPRPPRRGRPPRARALAARLPGAPARVRPRARCARGSGGAGARGARRLGNLSFWPNSLARGRRVFRDRDAGACGCVVAECRPARSSGSAPCQRRQPAVEVAGFGKVLG